MDNVSLRGMSKERNLLVQKDAGSYGLTLSGDKPVFVQSLRPGGAADRAGIRVNDVILRVNGRRVLESSHTEVVNIIQGHDAVTLTVVGSSNSPNGNLAESPTSPNNNSISRGSSPKGSSLNLSASMASMISRGSSKERITAPIPANQTGSSLKPPSNSANLPRKTSASSILRKLSFGRSDHRSNQQVSRSWSDRWNMGPRGGGGGGGEDASLGNIQVLRPSSSSSPLVPEPPTHENTSPVLHSVLSYPTPHLHTEAVRQLQDEKTHTMHLMVEQEQRNVDQLRQDLARQFTVKRQCELALATKRLDKLKEELENLRKGKPPSRPTSLIDPWDGAPDTPSPPPRPAATLPPPLPARNKASTPNLPFLNTPPPLPPPRVSPGMAPLPPPKKGQSSEMVSKKSPKRSNTTGSAKTNAEKDAGSPNKTPQASGSINISHERTKSSPSSLLDLGGENGNDSSTLSPNSSWNGFGRRTTGRVSPRYETPPGTPPPPYRGEDESLQSNANPLDGAQRVSWSQLYNSSPGIDLGSDFDLDRFNNMEVDDDDVDDRPGDTDAVFKKVSVLVTQHAHLTTFIKFIMETERDPAALFFFLLTNPDYYHKSLSNMQKWAYEVYSTFVLPGSPLTVPKLTEQIINDINSTLEEGFDLVEKHQKLFVKARIVARAEIHKQWVEFTNQRNAGFGSFYGPPDSELETYSENRTKELEIINDLLCPVIDSLSNDLENATNRTLAIAASLATIMAKIFHAKLPRNNQILERCPMYLSDKKSKLFGRNTKRIALKGHNFEIRQFHRFTQCNFSHEVIWGIGPQGYHCSNCDYSVLKKFVNKVTDPCTGSAKSRPKISKIVSDLALPNRKSSSASASGRESFLSYTLGTDEEETCDTGELQHPSGPHPTIPTLPVPRTPVQSSVSHNDSPDHSASGASLSGNLSFPADLNVPANLGASGSTEKLHPSPARGLHRDAAASSDHSASTSGKRVDRSQSLRNQVGGRGASDRDRRKNSDPNLPRGGVRASDVEVEIPTHQQNSSGSSTSSLSASRSSVDSPAGSQEMVTAASSSAVPSSSSIASQSHPLRPPAPSSAEHHYHTIDGDDDEAQDSDYETANDDWRKAMAQEDLEKLGKRETQRQDVINELFNTEKSHVRNLKVLERLFNRPLVEESSHNVGLPKEFVESLFPNLPDVLAWHNKCNQKMKDKVKRQGYPVGNIGDILSEMFDGENGDKLIEVSSTFTKNQKFTIEELKDRRRTNQRLEVFLNKQENQRECRRLQLQALLPMEHQRVVKYPLLLEKLVKNSEICDEKEQKILHNCQERARFILECIDKHVASAENTHKMDEIQRNLDTSGLEKFPDSPICADYRKVDLTKHKLLHHGSLSMKIGKGKTIDLYVLLLEDCIMLLQKQDDKYLLKFYVHSGGPGTVQSNTGKSCYSPVIKFSTLLVRNNASDKRSFYLLNTTQHGPQFYELSASSTGDSSKWFKHITEATNLHRFPDASKKTHDRGSDVSSQNGLSLDGSGQAGSSHDLLGASGYDSGKAASRSESFNDSSSFKRDQGGLEVDESLQKKTGDGSTTHGANEPSSTSSSGQRKRLQRVEILKIAEPCPLIDPSQVVVTQGAIFLAEAVLTPIEKLRRKDIEVARALEEKQRLIAEILNVPSEDFDHIADLASQPSSDKGAREVLLAALAQAKSLSDLVNQSLNLSDEDRIAAGSEVSANLSSTRDNTPTSPMATGEPHLHTSSGGRDGTAGSDSLLSQKFHGHFPGAMSKPTEKLVSISVHLNSHLTTLLGIIQERDEERERMKRELQRSQEQVHAYLSQSTSVRTSSMSALSPGSRPASFISVEESSGTGDLSEKGAQESGEDDGARPYANLFDPSEENHPPEPVTPTNPTPTAYEVDLEGSRTPDPLSSADATDFGQSSETSPSDSDKTVTELTPTESSVVSAPDNPESGPESAPVSMEPVGETDA